MASNEENLRYAFRDLKSFGDLEDYENTFAALNELQESITKRRDAVIKSLTNFLLSLKNMGSDNT